MSHTSATMRILCLPFHHCGMFTGLVEAIGQIEACTPAAGNIILQVRSTLAKDLVVGQSVAHNGVCLSITATNPHWHRVVAVAQTRACTTLDTCQVGDRLNLERALLANGRLEGHFVQGHVDTTLRCLAVLEQAGSWLVEIELPPEYANGLIPKGSICLDGISLTVFTLGKDSFKVAIIPQTWEKTVCAQWQVGNTINVEFDILGKYVSRAVPT